MVLTVTLNPLLEYRLAYGKRIISKIKRGGKVSFAAGGKGINVSKQLKQLGIQNIALTFSGGTFGKLFREAIKKEVLDFSLINVSSETRVCSVIIDSVNKKLSYYFPENPAISKEESNRFILQMEKMIKNCEIVVFSGSSPCNETDEIFPVGIEMAKMYDKISLCDTYGKHLENCYKASPRIVHNNVDEVKNSLSVKLNDEKDKLEFLDSLYKHGIKQTYLTDGANDFYSSNFDFHYKITVPKIESVDSTGSGDSFVSGIIRGWHYNLTFDEQVKFAVSLGAANARVYDVCNVTKKDVDDLPENVEVTPVGKKIKIIDDSPR